MDTTPFINPQDNPPPKNGDFLILLVKADRDNWQPTEDSEVFRTIGFNDFDLNGDDDTWRCAGWNWCQDEIVETTGEILGWLPMPDVPKCFLEQTDD
jgi:hypothetical protein